MKNLIKTTLLATTIAFSAASFANLGSYTDYLAEINAEITNFNPNGFAAAKADPAFEALENKLIVIIAQMKGYWTVASSSVATPAPVEGYRITDSKSYLAMLEESATNMNAKVFANFKQDPEFKKLEEELIFLMAEMSNFGK